MAEAATATASTKDNKSLILSAFSKNTSLNTFVLAKLLDDAFLGRREIKPLTTLQKDLSLEQGYEIQEQGIALRKARGDKLIGYKMGFTSKAKMEQMGLHSPIHGELTSLMYIQDGGEFDLHQAIHPKIEPEIVFVTKREITGDFSGEEIIESLSLVKAGLEILDSRFEGFKYFSLPDVVADNCSSHSFVVGAEGLSYRDVDLKNLQMNLIVNGKVVQSARSDAILGDPLESVIALSRMLKSRDRKIEAGSIILAGAATQAVPLEKGMVVTCEVQNLSSVSVKITDTRS